MRSPRLRLRSHARKPGWGSRKVPWRLFISNSLDAAPRKRMEPRWNISCCNAGIRRGTKDTADIVVINTCTVTAAADAQARDAIRKIRA